MTIQDLAIDPLYAAIVAVAALAWACLWACRKIAARRNSGDPLKGLFEQAVFDTSLDRICKDREVPPPLPKKAVPGQRAQMARLNEVWQSDARDDAIRKIGGVLRAGKRSSDRPVRITAAGMPVTDGEWEEVMLLPPPAPPKAA